VNCGARQTKRNTSPHSVQIIVRFTTFGLVLGPLVLARDENGFGIFRYSGIRFRNFSIGFIGNGIFQKRNRFSDFSIGIGVVFYRPFASVTVFLSESTEFLSRNFPELCLGNFRNFVSEFSSM
jgi:hypothetical protein